MNSRPPSLGEIVGHGQPQPHLGMPPVLFVPQHARQQGFDAGQGGFNARLSNLQLLIDPHLLLDDFAEVPVDGVLMGYDLYEAPDNLVIFLQVHNGLLLIIQVFLQDSYGVLPSPRG